MENAFTALDVLLRDKEELKNVTAYYCNCLHKVKSRHPKATKEIQEEYEQRLQRELSEADKALIDDATAKIRNQVIRINFELESVISHEGLTSEESKELKEAYNQIESKSIPEYNSITKYTQLVVTALNRTINFNSVLNTKKKMTEVSNALSTKTGANRL